MTKSLMIAVALLATTMADAQNAISFKFKLLPKHTYAVEAQTNIDSKVKSPSKNGKDQTFDNKGTMLTSYIIQTGAQSAKGNFPFLVTITGFSSTNVANGKKQSVANSPVKGAKSQGYCTPDGKMHTENLTFVTADDNTKKAIIGMINRFGDAINFPAKPLKIGESFTQVKPFTVANVNIKTTVTYTLTAIKGNLAYFNTKEILAMDVSGGKSNTQADVNGSGKGTMVYDIANSFATVKTDKLDSKMKMSMGGMNMTLDAVSASSYKAKISAN